MGGVGGGRGRRRRWGTSTVAVQEEAGSRGGAVGTRERQRRKGRGGDKICGGVGLLGFGWLNKPFFIFRPIGLLIFVSFTDELRRRLALALMPRHLSSAIWPRLALPL